MTGYAPILGKKGAEQREPPPPGGCNCKGTDLTVYLLLFVILAAVCPLDEQIEQLHEACTGTEGP
jgi:hypothetical protein